MENIVEIKHLTKIFKSKNKETTALSDINLTIGGGKSVSIIGGSGCGKSTLLRIIGGLETKYNGTVLVDGKKVEHASRQTGFIFQDHRLLPWLSVKENIRFGLPKELKNNDELIMENLKIVGLEKFAAAYPKELSGGMAQRVAIARALANKPKLLLLDEPFGALDAMTKMRLQDELLKIWKKEKITMIIVTHDIDEAIYLGNEIVVMTPHPGKIKRIKQVELETPRSRVGASFNMVKEQVYRDFFDTEEIPFVYSI